MKKRYQYVLFDLDGTLTDSKPGITRCVQYALENFGIREENTEKLEKFIGPPLRKSFPEFYGFDEEQTAQAIKNSESATIPKESLKMRSIHKWRSFCESAGKAAAGLQSLRASRSIWWNRCWSILRSGNILM